MTACSTEQFQANFKQTCNTTVLTTLGDSNNLSVRYLQPYRSQLHDVMTDKKKKKKHIYLTSYKMEISSLPMSIIIPEGLHYWLLNG